MDQGDVTQVGVVDLTITNQAQGDILYFNGTNWVRLAPGTADQSLRTGGAGANPAWETVDNATDLSIASQTTGDMLYYNGANWVRLAGGTSGDVLTANGAGVAPTYQTPAAGNGLSNVVFAYAGVDDAVASPGSVYHGKVFPTGPTSGPPPDLAGQANNEYYILWAAGTGGGYSKIMECGRYLKTAEVSTITVQGRSWDATYSTGYLQMHIGTANTTAACGSTTPNWFTPFTVDVSSLSNGTYYDMEVRGRLNTAGGVRFGYMYLSTLFLFAS